MLGEVILRSDLAPVPRTVEMVVRLKDGIEARLKKGAFFWAGRENLKYTVVKSQRVKADLIQGADQYGVLEVTGLLSSCAAVALPTARPIISDSERLGGIYRACGADVAITDDFVVSRFCCLSGGVPSFYIAQALQEEGAVMVLRDGRHKVTRLAELVSQAPKDNLGDSFNKIESDFLEKHEIPSFFSVAADGSFVFGDYATARSRVFLPRTNERVLRGASKVLVTRGEVDSQLAQTLQAGDVITANGVNMVIITAAHTFTQTEGITETNSKFWVGGLSE